MTLHAIVLQAPWAPLAAIGIKGYETRGFAPRTTVRPGDDLAIVCALKPDRKAPKWLGAWTYTLGEGTVSPEVHADDPEHGECPCPDPDDGAWSPECRALNEWRPALLRDEGAHGLSLVTTYLPGHVLAVVTYEGALKITASPWVVGDRIISRGDRLMRCHNGKGWPIDDQRTLGDFTPGRTAWPLSNPRPLADPVPCPARQPDGSRVHMQGVFTLPDHIEQAVRAQLATSRAVPEPGLPFPGGEPAPAAPTAAASTSPTPVDHRAGDRAEGHHPAPHDHRLKRRAHRVRSGPHHRRDSSMPVTVTDLFCGAGGSSTGAAAAGAEIVMAANHWATAIEVHQAHHPDAKHDLADISNADPRRYPVTDMLIASPECTNHSQARGVSRRRQDPSLWDAPDPSAERSRSTMMDVPRFAEQNRYAAGITENVVEVTKWSGWRAWRQWMEDLGYEIRLLSHNSMHHGVAQSRDRVYICWWRKGIRPNLELELTGWCSRCDADRVCRQAWKNGRTVGRYRFQYVYACTVCGTEVAPATQPAATIIDWSLPTPRIGDRTKPLAAKTRDRVYAGLKRHGWVPITTAGAGATFERTPGNRARPVATHPVDTQQTTLTTGLATPPGFLVRNNGVIGGDPGRHTTPVTEPARTMTATGAGAGQSLIVPMRNNGNAYDPHAEALGTVAANGNHHGLLMRNNTGGAEMVTSTDEPARSITTRGHQSLLMPYYGQAVPHPVDQPIGTVTTRDRHALIDPAQIIDDCGFRMLEPHEVAAAMAFPAGYIPDTYTKRDRVKLAGNAVTPPVMTWLMGRMIQALEAAA